jgi:DNA-binding response OmpR family regulator
MIAQGPSPVAGRKKLVVVEDDPETRELELFLLKSEGYQASGVADGEHAAEAVKREGADLVILDLMLPHKDGLQVLSELGADPATAATPVIVVSAYVQRMGGLSHFRRTRQVRCILEKPFDVTELLAAVSRELGGA